MNFEDFLEKPFNFSKYLEPPINTEISGFKIIKKIGEGSAGKVYLAEEISLNRFVALKITLEVGDEAKNMASLEHDHIVKVYSQKQNLICMAYIEGVSLDNYKEDLTISNILDWGIDLFSALEYAHQKNILHLDIKPNNILIQNNGKVFLTDFSVAIRSGEKILGGTLKYMPPEQLESMETNSALVDERSDVYSLAKVIKELLERESLKKLNSFQRIFRGEIFEFISKCLNPDKNLRPANSKIAKQQLIAIKLRWDRALNYPKINSLFLLGVEYPLFILFLLCVLPQAFGSLINISYNSSWIISSLTSSQQQLFHKLVLIYNFVSYPFLILWGYQRVKKDLQNKKVLDIPVFITKISMVGWLTGIVFFPTMLHIFSGPISFKVFFHFFVSIGISWGVSLGFMFLWVQSFVLQVSYPLSLVGEINTPCEKLLPKVQKRLRIYHYLVGYLPLFSILLASYTLQKAQVVVTFLVGLTALGFFVGMKESNQTQKVFNILLK